ncbi:MAG: error-prone DNA polymerase [Sphingobacteriales bacterium]|jgi:error-prone DNA polymerase
MFLNCHSQFSLNYGVLSVRRLLEYSKAKGLVSLALTDINNTSAIFEFLRLAPEYNIKPVVGVDFRNGIKQQFVAIAKNNKGLQEINTYLSEHNHKYMPFPAIAPQFENVSIIYPFSSDKISLRDNEFIGVSPMQLTKLPFSWCKNKQNKMVVLHSVTFTMKEHYNAHKVLRAIAKNELQANLSEQDTCSPFEQMVSPQRLEKVFSQYPQVIENTYALLSSCKIDFIFGLDQPNNNQQLYNNTHQEDLNHLRQLCEEGLPYRYEVVTPQIRERIDKELRTISEKCFTTYFLITWDILTYAREKDYFYVGRGSGANSIVAYLLRITDVDPIELDLYFERFINLFRQNPPDFDIDFSWTDREDVTKYIFNRFKHVSLIAAYSTFQYRAALREVGKTYGLPAHEIAELQRNPYKADEVGRKILQQAKLIDGLPSHLSVHAAGVLISEKPIHTYAATFLPPKGFPTAQFDMHVAEDVRLFKWDILGQRGLGKIKDAVQIVKYNNPTNPPIDIHQVRTFYKDQKIQDNLKEGKTIGCFYVESPAMRMLLKKLRVTEYIGLVAASSVIRPGVSQSGMMQTYIQRFRDPEKRKEAHPILAKLMPETFGVMVYQEDVIKVAHHFAGLSLADSDHLRRSMSGKYRSRPEFAKVKEAFFTNCTKKKYPLTLTTAVWDQIQSFAGYAFAKGHSASYAVESYQSLFLKTHYPLEYMVATLNNGGGFYSREFYIHEARMLGATIEGPCINRSLLQDTIITKTIYMGLGFVAGLETGLSKILISDRMKRGKYIGVRDLINRIPVSLDQISILIRVGAFRFTSKTKKQLMWDAHLMLEATKKSKPEPELFQKECKDWTLPNLDHHDLEDAYDEIELLGFALCSPYKLVNEVPNRPILARHLKQFEGKTVEVLGYLVHAKQTQTKNNDPMRFGTFVDMEGEFIDTVHFPRALKRHPFKGRGCYLIKGRVVLDYDFCCIQVTELHRLAMHSMEA